MDLDDLRSRSYTEATARAWGADMRPLGRDAVAVVVPGTPRFIAQQLSIFDLNVGPAAGPLGFIPGGLLGWALAALMQHQPLLYVLIGGILGWVLFAAWVTYAGRALIPARLGLPPNTQLVLVTSPAADMNADQRRLLELLDAAGDLFVREQIEDHAFVTAVADAIPALSASTTPAIVDAARANLERLLGRA